MELLGADNYELVKQDYQGWITELLEKGNGRDNKWTRSIAVGNKEFVDKVKSELGALAKGRDARETDIGYQLREPTIFYMHFFEPQNSDIELENAYFWNINA